MLPRQVTQDLEDTLNPRMLMRLILLHPAREKGYWVHATVVLSVVEFTVNETAIFTTLHAEAMASNRLAKANRASHCPRVLAKANRASHGPRVLAKGKSDGGKGKSKGKSKGSKSARGSYMGKTSRIGSSGLENLKLEVSSETRESAQTYHTTDNSWFHDGSNYYEWNDDWS